VKSGCVKETVEDIDTCTSVLLDEKRKRRGKPRLVLENVSMALQDRPPVLFLSLSLEEVPDLSLEDDLSLEEVPDLSLEVPEDLEDESSFVEQEEPLFLEAWPSCVFPR